MKIIQTLLFFLVSILLLSFTLLSAKHKMKKQPSSEQQVLTVLVKVIYDEATNQEQFTIENTILGEGFLKKGIASTYNVQKKEDFVLSFVSKDNTVISKTTISNPLNVRYEYAEESGKLTTIQVPMKEQIIPVRVNYEENMNSLRVEKKTNAQLRVISELKLNI